MNHVLVLCVGKDNSPEASEWQCSKVNQPDPTREKNNDSRVLLLLIYTLETQIRDCAYKDEDIIFH